jgi:hypothetical protein
MTTSVSVSNFLNLLFIFQIISPTISLYTMVLLLRHLATGDDGLVAPTTTTGSRYKLVVVVRVLLAVGRLNHVAFFPHSLASIHGGVESGVGIIHHMSSSSTNTTTTTCIAELFRGEVAVSAVNGNDNIGGTTIDEYVGGRRHSNRLAKPSPTSTYSSCYPTVTANALHVLQQSTLQLLLLSTNHRFPDDNDDVSILEAAAAARKSTIVMKGQGQQAHDHDDDNQNLAGTLLFFNLFNNNMWGCASRFV